jgi:hypothetical protein
MTTIYAFDLTPAPRHVLADFMTASQLEELKASPKDPNRPKGKK